MESLINEIVTASLGVLLLGGAYLFDLLVGVIKVLFTPELNWSWKKMGKDALKAVLWGISTVAFVAMLNVVEWYAGKLGADMSFLGDASFPVLVASILGGIGWYMAGAAKNIVAFIQKKTPVELDEKKLEQGSKEIADTVRSYFQSAEDSEPTDQEIEDAIDGTGGALVNPLSRILPDGDNDNGRGWQCCKYTWYLASGIRMNYAPHPDYGPVDGRYLAQYLIDKLGYVRCGKQVGAIFSYVNHTGIITKVNANGTVNTNDANWTPLRVGSHQNVNLDKEVNLMYVCRPEDLNRPNPTPTPTPTPAPSPAPQPVNNDPKPELRITPTDNDRLNAVINTIRGTYGNGDARKAEFERLGLDYNDIQNQVNLNIRDGHTRISDIRLY